MTTKPVYQLNSAGLYVGATLAHESPREPGVWLIPGGAIETAPPDTWPDHQWPRFNGAAWELITRPTAPAEPTATEKLAAFLQANPDVAALVTPPSL